MIRLKNISLSLTVFLLLCAGLLLPSQASAQFDLGKVKKSVEKRVEKEIDKEINKEGESEASDKSASENNDAAAPSKASTSRDPWDKTTDSEREAEEMLHKAHQAVRPLLDTRSVADGLLSQKKEAERFHEMCKKAQYPQSRQEAEAAVAQNPDLKRTREYEYQDIITRFPPHFDELVNTYLIKEINNAIEVAYAEKAKGDTRARAALEAAESAYLTADAVLLVTPDNARIKELKADAKAAMESMGAAMDKVFTSAFHKEHAGEIVFSNAPITVTQENAASMKSAFTANETIYGMMYFPGTFSEMTGGSNIAHTILLVDDNQMVSYVFKLDAGKRDEAWLKSEIIPDPSSSSTRGAMLFTEKLKDISPRRHRVTVRTTDDYGKTIAEGSFSLDCSGGTDPIAEVYRKLGNKKLSAVSLPAPAMRNAALEKQMMAALGEWKEKPLKVIITDRDWTIQHHPVTGAIVSRTINTTTVVKKADGSCRMFEISYKQQYAGGKYGKAQQYGVGDSADILCDKVK